MDIVERLRELSTWDMPELKYASDEIERLRGENQKLLKALTGLYEVCKWEKISPEIDAARKALGEKE
jgi:hypothetical protein